MKKIILMACLISAFNILNAQTLNLIKDSKSDYTIVLPENATRVESQSAKVLQDYLQRITHCLLPIQFDTDKETPQEILIGNVNRKAVLEIPYDTLGKDGLFIKTKGKKLILAGGDNKGTLYAVYTFLDKYLGCRKFSSDVTFVPKKNTIILDEIADIELPAFAFRETTYGDTRDPEYTDWHKLNVGRGTYNEKRSWGLWVHTFQDLVDPRIYGKDHPEYFSFYNGKRHPGAIGAFDGTGFRAESQLCLSNPEVLELVCEKLTGAMKKNPEILYWSVSQNDNVSYCQCEECTKLNKKYAAYGEDEKMIYDNNGAPQYSTLGMGSILSFINKVAERFPEKIISTLAYTYSRTPPKGISPRKNVNIMLCNIESARNKPLTAGDNSFSEDLSNWAKLTDNILVWDYTICFGNLLAPFPNLRTLQPNLQLFKKNGVVALYQQANRETGGEFAQLRAYLISRLMWNPDIDIQKEMNEFLNGYYGPAAKEISEYINLLHDNNTRGNVEMGIFDSPIEFKESFLSDALLKKYDSLFSVAYDKTRESETYYHRVQTARMPIVFAKLEIARGEGLGPRGMFYKMTDGTVRVKPEILKDLYEFVYVCNRDRVSRISEWHTTPNDYLDNYSWYFNLANNTGSDMNKIEGTYLFSMNHAPKSYRKGYFDLRKTGNEWTATIMTGYQKSPVKEVLVNGNHVEIKASISGMPVLFQLDINDGKMIGTTNYSEFKIPITASKVAEL